MTEKGKVLNMLKVGTRANMPEQERERIIIAEGQNSRNYMADLVVSRSRMIRVMISRTLATRTLLTGFPTTCSRRFTCGARSRNGFAIASGHTPRITRRRFGKWSCSNSRPKISRGLNRRRFVCWATMRLGRLLSKILAISRVFLTKTCQIWLPLNRV